MAYVIRNKKKKFYESEEWYLTKSNFGHEGMKVYANKKTGALVFIDKKFS